MLVSPLCLIKIDIVVNFKEKILFPEATPFDYQLAMDRLQGYRSPRDKLSRMFEDGSVVRVKQGLYLPGWRRGTEMPVDPVVLSGLVYGPSYVSLESALAHYGLIPERVSAITCVTSKRAKFFETPVGHFRYHPVHERVFPIGVTLQAARGGSYFLAEPEKALCDRLALIRGLSAIKEVHRVLEDDLRLDMDAVRSLSLPLIKTISDAYRRKNVRTFLSWLEREKKRETAS